MTAANYQAGATSRTTCRTCGKAVTSEQACAVLLDPGDPDTPSTGGLFILMPYALSMSREAGPYCSTDAAHRLVQLNARGPWTATIIHKELT